MPPKALKFKTFTRSRSREQGLEFEWSRELGGSVQVRTRRLEGTSDDPYELVDQGARITETSPVSEVDRVEVEVEVSSDESSQETSSEGSESNQPEEVAQLVWDNGDQIEQPILDPEQSILRRHRLDSLFGSGNLEAELNCDLHYPHQGRSWSVSVNRLDLVNQGDISPERRPRTSTSSSLPALQVIAEVHAQAGVVGDEEQRQDQVAEDPEDIQVVQVEGQQHRQEQVVQPEVAGVEEQQQGQPEEVGGLQEGQAQVPEAPHEVAPQAVPAAPQEALPAAEVLGMDETAYRTRSKQLDRKIKDIEDAIKDFTVEDVHDHDTDVATPLGDVKTRFEAFRTEVRDFCDEIDEEAHGDWTESWQQKLDTLHGKYKQNDRQVRAKLKQLKDAKEESVQSHSTSRNTSFDDLASIENKTRVKRKHLLLEMKDLAEAVKEAGSIPKLNDFDVVKYLKMSRKWQQELKEINKKIGDLEEITVNHPLPSVEQEELENVHAALKGDVKAAVRMLETEDETRQLYTLNQTSSKEAVPYPVFKGRPDEDIHKFIRDFKDAAVRNQIPRKDQVKILRRSLKNFALELIKEELSDIDEAYAILKDRFGNSDQIFLAKFDIFFRECEKKWPSIDSNPKELYQKTAKLVDQIKDLEKLIDEGSVDRGELYHRDNTKKLYHIMPQEILKESFKITNKNSTNQEKVLALKTGMELLQEEAEQRMILELDSKEKSSGNSPSHVNQTSQKKQGDKDKDKCFICKEDWIKDTHIREWSVFGCPVLLGLNREDRKSALWKKKACFTSGGKRNGNKDSNHRCRKLHEDLQCLEPSCKWNAMTCYHQKISEDTKQKVQEKLKIELQGFNVALIQDIPAVEIVQEDSADDYVAHLSDRIEDLQKGEVAKQMTNKQVLDWFQQRESKEGRDLSKILQIPEGETLFVFCLIKGRTRTLRAFMDGGCSSWLAKDGVPQNELRSVKLRDGPIPMWVAGGHTVTADAEWASLLPLNTALF